MGAVFGIFAGFYHWAPKIIGYTYKEILGKIHYYSFFIGVNLLFGPMHFLGLAGMPRRIGDYADNYHAWNTIASIGAMISLITVFLFVYILYDLFTSKIPFNETIVTNTEDYNTLFFHNSMLEFYPNNIDLEFSLPNPPKYHTFDELPVL